MNPLEIIEKYYKDNPGAKDILIAHGEMVAKKATELAKKVKHLNPDLKFIKEAAILHDIGIFLTNAPQINCYGDKFAEAADRCDMDWRLLPAIAVRESSGGKQACGNNPFGWASCRVDFESVEKAIEVVGSNLCGFNPRTESYYKNKTTYERLWNYNGMVNRNYPDEVLRIVDDF